jgi:hypothetical protein
MSVLLIKYLQRLPNLEINVIQAQFGHSQSGLVTNGL